MEIAEALRAAAESRAVAELRKKRYVLGSVFASAKEGAVNEWVFHYFSKKKKKTVDCFVSGSGVSLGRETPSIAEMKELDPAAVGVTAKKVLKTAARHFKKNALTVMLSLHTRERLQWTVSMIARDMTVATVTIDAATGNVLETRQQHMIKMV